LKRMRDFADCLARRCVRAEPKGSEGLKKRWRKKKTRRVPSSSAVFDIWLSFMTERRRG